MLTGGRLQIHANTPQIGSGPRAGLLLVAVLLAGCADPLPFVRVQIGVVSRIEGRVASRLLERVRASVSGIVDEARRTKDTDTARAKLAADEEQTRGALTALASVQLGLEAVNRTIKQVQAGTVKVAQIVADVADLVVKGCQLLSAARALGLDAGDGEGICPGGV